MTVKEMVVLFTFTAVLIPGWWVDSREYVDEPLLIGDNPEDETFIIDSKTEFYHTGGIMVTGKGTLLVKGTLHQKGDVYITENGTLKVDNGAFHLEGNDTNIYLDKKGTCIFKNSVLHYVQHYVGQHNLIAGDNGHFEFVDSHVFCDGSIEFIHLADNASYTAKDTEFSDWTTWYCHNNTALSLKNVNYAGDIVFYDSPTLHFVNTHYIMPWLYFGEGAIVDYTFPQNVMVTTTLDNAVEGIANIPWTLTMENCSHVAWGINPYPKSDVTVRDSYLTMVLFRFAGEGECTLHSIMKNNTYYNNEPISVNDRNLRLINTYVKWWKVDVVDTFLLRADSIVFSEMVLKNNATAYLTNAICEGQTIHVGATHNAFLHFSQGEVWSYVSVWDNAVMVLQDSTVDWEKGKFIYQTSNIAHGNSRLYCLNTILKERPIAVDSALVMVACIGLTCIKGDTIIPGSAWIDAGPESDITFARYTVSWSRNNTDWTVITESVTPVEGVLGVWDTSGLPEGVYTVRLTIWVHNDTSDHPPHRYPVYKAVTLFSDVPWKWTPV
jgi:hypothetical protein